MKNLLRQFRASAIKKSEAATSAGISRPPLAGNQCSKHSACLVEAKGKFSSEPSIQLPVAKFSLQSNSSSPSLPVSPRPAPSIPKMLCIPVSLVEVRTARYRHRITKFVKGALKRNEDFLDVSITEVFLVFCSTFGAGNVSGGDSILFCQFLLSCL